LLPVINATGVIVHTNLGRAPLSRASIEAVANVAANYSNLEYDLEDGARGSRTHHAEQHLLQLTGAEAALAVNNNAAAILLMLSALCQGKEVIISRGQLIEIGGGFRVPDVMAQSGAKLVEVGTTNRTHLRDYAEAITDETAAILVAHHSNFRIVGFTSEPELSELSELGQEHGILTLYDQGSGVAQDTSPYGLGHEITVQAALRSGVDIVAFSGDKLLGGPQAGILCGRGPLIGQIKGHPLARAVRADKMCLAALAETLKAHVTGRAMSEIPVWRMISATKGELSQRAQGWVTDLQRAGLPASMCDGQSTVGGGSLPGSTLPTSLVAVDLNNVEMVAKALRAGTPPVVGRITDDQLILDPRTVLEEQDQVLLTSIISAASTQVVDDRTGEYDD
jgi:L-seryl-tRNA(Ser) seleniumtransferase